MRKNGGSTGKVQPDVAVFKKMCRLLEFKRRQFFEDDWKNCARTIPRAQFNHLMLVRFSMPCNLGAIMRITGLTSAGASLFVDKLVEHQRGRNRFIGFPELFRKYIHRRNSFMSVNKLFQFRLFHLSTFSSATPLLQGR